VSFAAAPFGTAFFPTSPFFSASSGDLPGFAVAAGDFERTRGPADLAREAGPPCAASMRSTHLAGISGITGFRLGFLTSGAPSGPIGAEATAFRLSAKGSTRIFGLESSSKRGKAVSIASRAALGESLRGDRLEVSALFSRSFAKISCMWPILRSKSDVGRELRPALEDLQLAEDCAASRPKRGKDGAEAARSPILRRSTSGNFFRRSATSSTYGAWPLRCLQTPLLSVQLVAWGAGPPLRCAFCFGSAPGIHEREAVDCPGAGTRWRTKPIQNCSPRVADNAQTSTMPP